MSYLNPSVRALAVEGVQLNADTVHDNTYPLRATLFIAGEAEPQQPEYRMFIGWIQSPAGQAVVAHSHAPLLRPEPENETN
jgi:ABC-type phosphate transport system substrate-binding protein